MKIIIIYCNTPMRERERERERERAYTGGI